MPTQVFETPNPNAHKYVLPGRSFKGSLNYSSAESAAASPLAAQLFRLAGVYNVFLAQDFVTVNKRPDASWDDLDPRIVAILDLVAAL